MNIERMANQLVAWGLIPQVRDMEDAGYALSDAITLVYIAHTRGKAYTAAQYAV